MSLWVNIERVEIQVNFRVRAERYKKTCCIFENRETMYLVTIRNRIQLSKNLHSDPEGFLGSKEGQLTRH